MAIREAEAAVLRAVSRSRSSFAWAMRLLPRPRRMAMYAVYAYCRALDDIADEPGDPGDKLARLDAWRGEIDALYAGRPRHPIARTLLAPVRDYGLERAEFEGLIDGMEMDVRGRMVAPPAALLDLYCRRVAGTVGLLSVRIFGAVSSRADAFALSLGNALQLTNILRDLDEDAAMGRLYLPRELLNEAGIAATGSIDAVLAHPALPSACESLAGRARRHYREAEAALAAIDANQVRPALAMMAGYRRLLARLERRGWRQRTVRPRLGVAEAAFIALRHALPRRP